MLKKSSLVIGALALTAVAIGGCQKGGDEEASSSKWTPPKPEKKVEAPATTAAPAAPAAPVAPAPTEPAKTPTGE